MPALPDLTGLPPFVQIVAYAIFGGGLGVMLLQAVLGYLRGKNAPAGADAQLTMLTLDSSAIREHVAVVRELREQMERLNDLGDRYLEVAAEQRGYDRGRNERTPTRTR